MVAMFSQFLGRARLLKQNSFDVERIHPTGTVAIDGHTDMDYSSRHCMSWRFTTIKRAPLVARRSDVPDTAPRLLARRPE
jgi:hypothetical protein